METIGVVERWEKKSYSLLQKQQHETHDSLLEVFRPQEANSSELILNN